MKDAYDRWIEWIDRPLEDDVTLPSIEREAVMSLPARQRLDRKAVNQAVERAYQAIVCT